VPTLWGVTKTGLQLFPDSQCIASDLHLIERLSAIWGMIRHLRQGLETVTLWAGWAFRLTEQAIQIVDGIMRYRGEGRFSQSASLFLGTCTSKDVHKELPETTCSIIQ